MLLIHVCASPDYHSFLSPIKTRLRVSHVASIYNQENDGRIVLLRAKSIALLRPKMQIFKNKLSFNILVACYYIANSVDIKERNCGELPNLLHHEIKIQLKKAKYRATCMITVSH